MYEFNEDLFLKNVYEYIDNDATKYCRDYIKRCILTCNTISIIL